MLITHPTRTAVRQAVRELKPAADEVVLLLFGEQGLPDIDRLTDELCADGVLFFGGVFPGLIYEDQSYRQGCLLKKFKAVAPPVLFPDLAADPALETDSFDLSPDASRYTAITFVDGLASSLSPFLESLNNLIGDRVTFIGGGAGTLALKSRPCVFSAEGYCANAAVCCIVENEISLSVRHGWQKLAGPYIATRADGNRVYTLNWQKVGDVYQPAVTADSGRDFSKEDFFDIAKGYPFGMIRENAEDVVRDPIGLGASGELICVGEVPAHTLLYLLKGEKDGLIRAAEEAARACTTPAGAGEAFIVDCISRKLFLGDEFREELAVLNDALPAGIRPEGVLSLGELSSYSSGLLEFFNKTVIVGLMSSNQISH